MALLEGCLALVQGLLSGFVFFLHALHLGFQLSDALALLHFEGDVGLLQLGDLHVELIYLGFVFLGLLRQFFDSLLTGLQHLLPFMGLLG